MTYCAIALDSLIIDIAAYLIMICGGMFLSYGVFNNFIGYQNWNVEMSTFTIFFISGSFHIALLIGALSTSFVYTTIDISSIHVSFYIYILIDDFKVNCLFIVKFAKFSLVDNAFLFAVVY